MSKDRNEFTAGLFILIAFALAVAVVVRIKDATVGAKQVRTVSFKMSDHASIIPRTCFFAFFA